MHILLLKRKKKHPEILSFSLFLYTTILSCENLSFRLTIFFSVPQASISMGIASSLPSRTYWAFEKYQVPKSSAGSPANEWAAKTW